MNLKTFCLSFLWLGLTSFFTLPLVAAETRTVDRPAILGGRSMDLYLFRVTCTSEATILRLNAYGVAGNWVRLAEGAFLSGRTTGRKYRLVRAEGIELGKKITLPESGTIPFTLRFEPLDKADECFDFFESTSADAWHLEGISLVSPAPAGKVHCRIEGSMEGHPECSLLFLVEHGQDFRIVPPVLIPVEDGRFVYDLYTDGENPYELCSAQEYFSGRWYSFPFLSEAGVVCFSFPAGNFYDGVQIRGGEQTNRLAALYFGDREEKKRLERERDSLMAAGLYFTPELMELREQWEAASSDSAHKALQLRLQALQEAGKAFSPAGKALEERYGNYIESQQTAQRDYMYSDCSLAGYYFLHRELAGGRWQNDTLSTSLMALVGRYAGKYPDHWFTKACRNLVASACMSRPGGKALDFEAQDLQGVSHRFSDLRQGQIVLLDLWASWCGPCRRHSKEMIPVYEAYKNRGFSVVAVARERENTAAMQAAMEQDGYPWPSLVDLDDRNRVWERLGVGNAGGKVWLVDRDGTVLLVDPTPEEVQRVLEEILK